MTRPKLTLRSITTSALALASATVPLVALQAPAQAADTATNAEIQADSTSDALRDQMLLTPLKQQTVTTEINLPSHFDSQWKVRTNDGDSLKQYTTNKITSSATGLVGFDVATLNTNKTVGFAQGSADNSKAWAEIGTSGNVLMVASGEVNIPMRVSVGSYFKNFTVTVPYSANGTQTVELPQDVVISAADQGLNLSGTTITVNTSVADLPSDAKRVPAVCWTPTTEVANKIDIANSQGIARVGNTFVIPGGIVIDESTNYKRVKLASNVAFKGTSFQGRLSGLELEFKDNGFGSALVNLYSYVGTTDADGKTTYSSLQQVPLLSSYADFADSNWDFNTQPLSQATLTGEVINSFGSPLLSEANDYQLGDMDLGCSTHTSEFQQGYNYLVQNAGPNITYQEVSFADVDPTQEQFYASIVWASDNGILRGWSDGTFRPNESISRAAVAASLYRLAGSPAYTAPEKSPFKDVPVEHPFYTEIAWMQSVGLTTGWSDGTFRPDQSINRDAIAAFLYRFAGSPDYTAPATSAFTDVSTDNQFYKEISWLKDNNISTGWADGTFRPTSQIARNAMAAFLHRYTQQIKSHI